MADYTEEEIRKAFQLVQLVSGNVPATAGGHEHDFTDTDTITAKEVRDAWRRLDALQGPGSVTVSSFLRDISEHREPAYKTGKVYRDKTGVYYRRAVSGAWQVFGTSRFYDDRIPERPLREMP